MILFLVEEGGRQGVNCKRILFYQDTICLIKGIFLGFLVGCSTEPDDQSFESDPPEKTEIHCYEVPEGAVGFSPESRMVHCVVFAGYDSNAMEAYFCDPADNFETGHKSKSSFNRNKIKFINGFCTTTIAGKPATFVGAVIIRPPSNDAHNHQKRWTLYGMPDLSQHAIQPEWNCYSAPASAANLICYFAQKHPELSPRIVFAKDEDFVPRQKWLYNRLIAGNQVPFPREKSMADRMSTSTTRGSSYNQVLQGFKAYIDDNTDNPDQWNLKLIMENQSSPEGRLFWDQLTVNCSTGNGVLLGVTWGVPVASEPVQLVLTQGSNSPEQPVSHDADSDSSKTKMPKDPEGSNELPKPDLVPEMESQPVEIEIPEVEEEEGEPDEQKEILDVETVIVDDFDLEERAGIWYRKGEPRPFTGIARRSYPSGSKLLEIPYLNGERDGMQRIWKENGELQREVMWQRGNVLRNP